MACMLRRNQVRWLEMIFLRGETIPSPAQAGVTETRHSIGKLLPFIEE